jgi:hypothetical protein
MRARSSLEERIEQRERHAGLHLFLGAVEHRVPVTPRHQPRASGSTHRPEREHAEQHEPGDQRGALHLQGCAAAHGESSLVAADARTSSRVGSGAEA